MAAPPTSGAQSGSVEATDLNFPSELKSLLLVVDQTLRIHVDRYQAARRLMSLRMGERIPIADSKV